MKKKMLAHIQTDGSTKPILLSDISSTLKTLLDEPIGTTIQFVVIEQPQIDCPAIPKTPTMESCGLEG